VETPESVGAESAAQSQPSRRSPAAEPSQTDQNRSALAGHGEQVLVVDDELLVRDYITTFLIHVGYRVHHADSASTGFQTFLDHRDQIDLVLIDYSLPDMSGMDLLSRMVAVSPRVKAILTSGMDELALGKAVAHPNVCAHLQKPFFGDHLLNTIRKALEQR
jgi:DNA-binding NtrC family response regulator